MTEQDSRPVAVGVDGSPESLRAVRVAARHAAARGVELRIVHAGDSVRTSGLPRQLQLDPEVFSLLADAEAAACVEMPGLEVHRSSALVTAQEVLLGQAERAALLAIGHRGLGDRTGQLVGSLAAHLAGNTACPLMLVHHIGDRSGPVVVGVDDPPASEEALREGFRQARTLDRPLRVVHAWHVPLVAVAGSVAAHGYPSLDLAQVDAVAAEAERIGREFPGVAVTTESHHGHERSLLSAAAEGASLLVLGAPASAGLRRLLQGLPALAAAQHAACPVLIVAEPGGGGHRPPR